MDPPAASAMVAREGGGGVQARGSLWGADVERRLSMRCSLGRERESRGKERLNMSVWRAANMQAGVWALSP